MIVILRDCTFDNNGANRSAGAIYVNNCTYVSIDNSNFENNNVNYSGGAIYFKCDYGRISNSNFTNNKARYNGAACVNGESGSVINCIFTNNVATESAGALGWERKGNGNIEKSNNSAPRGGAIYQNSATNVSILNSIFDSNTASEDGGAIFWDHATGGKIIGSTFNDNYVIGRGGAIEIVNASNCEIGDCTFDNNGANSSAGAIYVNNCTYISIDNSKFENNVDNEGNYSIDNNYGTIYLYNNTINTKSSEIRNYGGNISSPCTAIVMSHEPFIYGIKTKLISFIKDDNENLIEECYPVYFNVNGSLVEAKYNSEISGYEAEYVFNTLGLVEISTVCPSINITDNQGINSTVTKSTELTASSVITTYNVAKKLVVTLKDSDEVLANKKVTVKVGKISKTLKTNSKGQISVDVSKLTPKAYTASISFAGDNYYSSSSKSVKVTVKKATPKLTAKAKSFKKSIKTKKYSITFKTNKNKAMKKAKVTLKVKGKTYTTITNSKGKATFKITKLTKKGTYKAVIKYKGNSYYNKVTKKVNIKLK
ncbi:right-handed parallel beta-helix repeat-containing protein [uncultured Methanobrevibacter sp.]|uniref:right-handed parallel beta-helix repeat-containing protein n=1 Tax=uncultured Methanobrevibacter sp. TaxID=253161 RepID=UPI0025D13B85|nr:hypothetical protein [uncultured Methanobrevibacter sp.]